MEQRLGGTLLIRVKEIRKGRGDLGLGRPIAAGLPSLSCRAEPNARVPVFGGGGRDAAFLDSGVNDHTLQDLLTTEFLVLFLAFTMLTSLHNH